MQFNDTTNKLGLVQDCDFLVTSNSTSYPLEDKARSANMALNEVATLILSADGRWQWDDTNYTDLPIGTTDIVSGQKDYGIDTTMIEITRVECKDAAGNWKFLTPFDQKDLNQNTNQAVDINSSGNSQDNSSLTSFLSTAGNPVYYDKMANSIFLYPTPNYNSTDGLKVYFKRAPSYFTAADTTKKPGFASHLHRYISLSMAKDYAVAKMLNGNKLQSINNELALLKNSIIQHYGRRQKDIRNRMVAFYQNNK